MIFRKTTAGDIARIMEIVAQAQERFRALGIDQWQDGYPAADVFLQDMDADSSYVVETGSQVMATACISFDVEPAYSTISDGAWPDDEPYAVIHRLAVDRRMLRRGIAAEIIAYAEMLCRLQRISSIRVDTHRDNTAMRRLLDRCGFTRCGRIRLDSGAEREAYCKRFAPEP